MVRDIFRLDEDLSPLYALLRGDRRRRWVEKHGAGRVLRAPTAFEDLVKLLMTTNCSWAATQGMVNRLLETLGEVTPSGARAFPRPDVVARKNVSFLRNRLRVGYRDQALADLACSVSKGELDPEDWRRDPPEREDVLALKGFGPYAAGHMMRMLGAYEDLCLDSWVRGKLARMEGRKKPPSDKAIAKRYSPFGEWAGLVLWLDLTEDWHKGD